MFLDTSVWIAAILSDRGASAFILDLAARGALGIASSLDVFDEAVRNLQEKYPQRLQNFVDQFQIIQPRLVQPNKQAILKAARIINPNDAPILAAAMVSKTNILVTLDRKHFILPKKVAKKSRIKIMLPGDFLKKL